jgi:dolichol-phosphate mannosyltransferase
LQDPPEVILEFISRWREGNHVVYGVRVEREGEGKFKLWTAKIFYRVIRARGAGRGGRPEGRCFRSR